MRRREFITFFGGLISAWAFNVHAQPLARTRRVGVLMALAADDPETQARVKALEQALHQLGWTDPSQIHLDYRWPGGDLDRIRSYAAELVSSAPDVILANATPALVALLPGRRKV
jgi:putative ABC transport system substrate-binding protein